MYNAICYDLKTGRIQGITYVRDTHLPMPNEIIMPSEPPSNIGGTHYVVNEVVLERPVMPLVVHGHKITGIPFGAKVTVKDTAYTVDDGELDIEFSYPGLYEIRVSLFPYIDHYCEMTA